MTMDEAMFYLGGSYGRRRDCHISKWYDDPSKLTFVNVICFHQVSWVGLELVFTAKPRFGLSIMMLRSIHNLILTKF